MIIEALNNGKIIKWNVGQPRYYAKVDGIFYFSDTPNNVDSWRKSAIKECTIKAHEKDFKII